MENHCCICSQIEGDREGDLISSALGEADYVRRIAMENSSFAVIPSLGPIVPGHTLLCPKSHFRSFSGVASAGRDDVQMRLDYSTARDSLISSLQSVYINKVHIFEHGSARDEGRVLCTVEHAHLHFVPTDVEISEDLRKDADWRPIGRGLDDLAEHVGDAEYLYYLPPNGDALVCSRPNGFESQWMRQLFCQKLGVLHRWNWREEMNAEEADACFRVLKSGFRLAA